VLLPRLVASRPRQVVLFDLFARVCPGGKFVANSGIAMLSGESATPRSSMPILNRNRPVVAASPVVRFEKETAPVRCERTRQVAVADWPGARLPSSTVSSLSSTPPLMLAPPSVTLTWLATLADVFRTVTLASYGSPARTVRGCVKANENFGLRTSTDPAAFPITATVPAATLPRPVWNNQ
jgi:hypothetical protein